MAEQIERLVREALAGMGSEAERQKLAPAVRRALVEAERAGVLRAAERVEATGMHGRGARWHARDLRLLVGREVEGPREE